MQYLAGQLPAYEGTPLSLHGSASGHNQLSHAVSYPGSGQLTPNGMQPAARNIDSEPISSTLSRKDVEEVFAEQTAALRAELEKRLEEEIVPARVKAAKEKRDARLTVRHP